MIRLRYSLREPLLIVRLSILNPVSHHHHETGKRENLSRSYLCLAHSTWARWWRSCPSQVGTPFLIAYSCSCLMKTHKLLTHTQYGRDSFRHIFTYPFPSSICGKLQAYSFFEMSILNLHFALIKLESFLLTLQDILHRRLRRVHAGYSGHFRLNSSQDHSLDLLLYITLVNTWSSLLYSSFHHETNIWSTSIAYGQILQV